LRTKGHGVQFIVGYLCVHSTKTVILLSFLIGATCTDLLKTLLPSRIPPAKGTLKEKVLYCQAREVMTLKTSMKREAVAGDPIRLKAMHRGAIQMFRVSECSVRQTATGTWP
jgi:hypothetical protein